MNCSPGQANAYTYTGGDPVNYIDPFGYHKTCIKKSTANTLNKVTQRLGKTLGKAVAKRVATTAASWVTGPGAALVAVANIGLSLWDMWRAKDDLMALGDLLSEADLDYTRLDPLAMMMAMLEGQAPVPLCDNDPPRAKKGKDAGDSKGKAKTCEECKKAKNKTAGHPVNAIHGCKVLGGEEDLDFVIQAPMPLVWQRHYASDNAQVGLFGQGWRTLHDCFVRRETDRMAFYEPNGRTLYFDHLDVGEHDLWVVEQLTLSRPDTQTYQIITGDNSVLRFTQSAQHPDTYTLARVQDANGNGLRYFYNGYLAPQPDCDGLLSPYCH